MRPTRYSEIRGPRWTPARQLAFLAALSRTRSVSRSAAFAGMSRESAYRLRRRPHAGLFAALWDAAMDGPVLSQPKGHISVKLIARPPGGDALPFSFAAPATS